MNYYIKFLGKIFLICSIIIKQSHGQSTSCTTDDYKYMSTKTDYNLIGNKTNYDLYNMPMCSQIGLWHLSRHGGRYPDRDDIKLINDFMPKMRDLILNSSATNNWLCDKDKEDLKIWKSRMQPDDDNLLTSNGMKWMRMLGARMRSRLLKLIKPIEIMRLNKYQKVLTTFLIRTQQSAREYMSGFFSSCFAKPEITYLPEDDYLLKFPDLCEKYIKQVDKNSSACPEVKDFDKKSVEYAKAQDTFKARINVRLSNDDSEQLFELALKLCQHEFLMDGTNSVWCRFFDPDILKLLEYREDIKYNCKYGYRHEISRLMTCDLVGNLVDSLKIITESPKSSNISKINVYFTHSSTMLPIFTVVGIANNSNNFDFNDIATENKNRSYKITKLDPMNSNIAFVLYNCENDSSNPFKVRAFHNENLIQLNGCSSTDCQFSEFLRYYSQFKNNCGSSKKVCELKKND